MFFLEAYGKSLETSDHCITFTCSLNQHTLNWALGPAICTLHPSLHFTRNTLRCNKQ